MDMEIAMNRTRRLPGIAPLLAAAALFLLLPGLGFADEPSQGYLTPEQYIEQARPYLHLSCEGAWKSVDADPEAYIEIVNKLAPIGFLNHEFDVAKLEAMSAEELQALKVEYYNEVGRLCRENPQNLLAGVIEQAQVEAFARLDSMPAEP